MLPKSTNYSFNKKAETQYQFGGYYHDLTVPDGAFYDMQDASCDRYPVLGRRRPRRELTTIAGPQGLGQIEGRICWVKDNKLYYNNVVISPIKDNEVFHEDARLTANGVMCHIGDINADGSIDVSDIMCAIQLAARKLTPETTLTQYDDTVGGLTKTQKVLLAADIDGDGVISVADALAILRHVVYNVQGPVTCDADLNGDGQVTLDDAFLCAEIAQGADKTAQEAICAQITLDGRSTLDAATVFNRAHVVSASLTDPISNDDASAILAYLYSDSGLYSLQNGEKQLVPFGRRLLIFPDKLYFDTETQEIGRLDAVFIYSGTLTATPCTIEGAAITITTTAETPPSSPADGEYWLDTSSENKVLKLWSGQEQKWVSIPTAYTKISAPGIGKMFRDYDGVNIKLGNENPDAGDDVVNGNSYIIWGHGDDHIIISAFASDIPTSNGIVAKRVIPDMDFVCEKDNRLWGCSSEKNEIYCSVKGDPSNFYRYLGVSGDGWAASQGSPGEFTGCIAYDNSVLFFKEHTLHRVYGNRPANFTVSTEKCEGVEKTSARSLAIVGGVLYYNSPRGVQAYYSSFRFVGAPFGGQRFTHASGCAFERKYYFSAYDGAEWCVFVYDTEKNVWTKETSPGGYAAPFWTEWDGDLVFCANNALFSVTGDGHFFSGTTQDDPEWYVETGDLLASPAPDKHLHGLQLRYSVPIGGYIKVYVAYDGGDFRRVWVDEDTVRIVAKDVPLEAERCDYLRVKIVCSGDVKLYAMTRIFSL